MLPAITVYCTN
uniref:Uncharacterized protein n=1 Tax=Arundo donax TaxID=35708 RepID=A0A0A9AIG6_ARUDO